VVVEFGTFYAAPFGTALLSDLGARVIKLEQLDGDPIRFQALPEVGGVKVTQGKESIAVDITRPEGRQIALELVRRAHIILRSFRGGVAERLGYDDETLLGVNPDLVYLNAPGFGVDGPYGHRPAYAPVIGAGSGFARRNAGVDVPESADLSIAEIKEWAARSGGGGVAHCDGFAALGVATALALGLLARARGAPGQSMLTTMLSTMAHVLADDMIEYAGRPAAATVTPDRLGFSALYRFYQASDGWMVLTCPSERDWRQMVSRVDPALGDDPRFASGQARLDHDEELTEALTKVFETRTASDWEKLLLDVDVTCAALVPGPYAGVLMDPGGVGEQLGLVTEVVHPVFGRHLRMKPLVTLSRSGGRAEPGCAIGQHTDSIMTELGYSAARIAELRELGVLGAPPAGEWL
jgi:crotonobetainyl-CoA:carnitine CoA-transferase CaiB-like acyl-CoA transferase